MFRKLGHWIKDPHGRALVAFYIFTALTLAGAVVCTVLAKSSYAFLHILAYILYGVAAIASVYTVYTVVRYLPELRRKLMRLARKYEFTDRLVSQYGYRTIILSVGSLAISTAYALFNGVIALLNFSVWYGALAAYYILLASMRGGIIFHHNRNRRREHAALLSPSPEDDIAAESDRKIRAVKTYRACGAALIFLPLCLSGAVTQMVLSQRTYNYTGVMLYVAAAYTFYKIVMSVVNLVKAHRADDPTVRAVRNINFADALVSVLALQTALIRAFVGDVLKPLNAVVGFAVCALTVVLGIAMVIKANKTLRYCPYIM